MRATSRSKDLKIYLSLKRQKGVKACASGPAIFVANLALISNRADPLLRAGDLAADQPGVESAADEKLAVTAGFDETAAAPNLLPQIWSIIWACYSRAAVTSATPCAGVS
jgi:hypothetical protein